MGGTQLSHAFVPGISRAASLSAQGIARGRTGTRPAKTAGISLSIRTLAVSGSWRIFLKLIPPPFPGCWTAWSGKALSTRRQNQASRRCNLVEVTEKGKQAYAVWQQRCQEMEQVLLKDFSAQEKEQFFCYLSRIYQNFQNDKEERSCRT